MRGRGLGKSAKCDIDLMASAQKCAGLGTPSGWTGNLPSATTSGSTTHQVRAFPWKTMICGLYSTCASPVVPHLSTRHAHGCLASEIGRDPAFPTRYDRTENSSRVTSPDSDMLWPHGPGAERRSRVLKKGSRPVFLIQLQASVMAEDIIKANTDPTTKA